MEPQTSEHRSSKEAAQLTGLDPAAERMLNKQSHCYKHAMKLCLFSHNIIQIRGHQTLLSRQVNGIQGHL